MSRRVVSLCGALMGGLESDAGPIGSASDPGGPRWTLSESEAESSRVDPPRVHRVRRGLPKVHRTPRGVHLGPTRVQISLVDFFQKSAADSISQVRRTPIGLNPPDSAGLRLGPPRTGPPRTEKKSAADSSPPRTPSWTPPRTLLESSPRRTRADQLDSGGLQRSPVADSIWASRFKTHWGPTTRSGRVTLLIWASRDTPYMGITFQDPLGPYHEKWEGYTPYMGIT